MKSKNMSIPQPLFHLFWLGGGKQIDELVNPIEQEEYILDFLRPETDEERSVLSKPEMRQGLFWGKPRYGHPEGQVIRHIREVLDNVDRLAHLSRKDRETLRMVTIVHDAFKYKEYELCKLHGRQPRYHHATLAADFYSQFTRDTILLQLIRWHDEAYYCWKHLYFGQTEAYERRLEKLLNLLGDHLQLYYLFFKCDTMTGDKTQVPLRWFEATVKGIEVVEMLDFKM